jgi:hypothetical protein
MLLTVKVKTSIKEAEREIAAYEQSGGNARDLIAITGSRSLDLKSRIFPSNDGLSSMQSSKKTPDSSSTRELGRTEYLMSGYCAMAKSADAKSMVADYLGLGGKKTKRRRCFLDVEAFNYSTEKDTDVIAGTVPLMSIVDIRNFTSESSMAKISAHCFEIEAENSKVLSFGCESSSERDNWVTALRVARDNKCRQQLDSVNSTKLSVEESKHYLEQFRKNLSLYESIWMEDRKYTTTAEGLDTGNFNDILRFVQLQSLAENTESKLHELLYQLAILPPGMEGMWDIVISSAKKYRAVAQAQGPGEEIPVRASVQNSTTAYQQMSKLALLVITAENEVKALRQRSSTATRRVTGMRQSFTELGSIGPEINNSRANSPVEVIESSSTQSNGAVLSVDVGAAMKPYSDAINALSVSPSAPVSKSMSFKTIEPIPIDLKDSQVEADTSSSSMIPKFEKFVKMKKMLPEGAVRQKMSLEGFTAEEIDSFMSGSFVDAPPTDSSNTKASAESAVAPAVDPRFEKFVKMKKVLPEGAVRQKMSLEGFTEEEIDDFMSGKLRTDSSAAFPSAPTESAIDPRFEKFLKMKKMLPEGAVRQKMSLEGFTEEEINLFFDGSLTAKPLTAMPAAAPALDPRFGKYVKMKTMLPEGAVRQKMSLEGFTQSEIDLFFGEANPLAAMKADSPAKPAIRPPVVVDPALEKYVKMQRMLPEGAVRQKMAADGISQDVIDSFFGATGATAPKAAAKEAPKAPKPVVHQPPAGFATKPVLNPTKKMKALFWTKVEDPIIGNTVWKRLASEETSLTSAETSEMEEWFSAAAAAASKKAAEPSGEDSKAKVGSLSLLDGKKTQNVLIALGKLRMPPEKIVQCIVQVRLLHSTVASSMALTTLDIH